MGTWQVSGDIGRAYVRTHARETIGCYRIKLNVISFNFIFPSVSVIVANILTVFWFYIVRIDSGTDTGFEVGGGAVGQKLNQSTKASVTDNKNNRLISLFFLLGGGGVWGGF